MDIVFRDVNGLGKKHSRRPMHAAAADFFRAFCVFMVAWYHIWQQSWLRPHIGTFSIEPWVRAGYMFVDGMLMLSGFLLYLPYAAGEPKPLKAFYRRRGARILPSYFFCLLVMLVLARMEGTPWSELLPDLLAHLTFTHNLFQSTYTGTALNVALWTLAVEVQFYAIFPLLAEAFRKRPYAVYIVMCAAGYCFRNYWTVPLESTVLYVNRLPNMLEVYANGMLASHFYVMLTRCGRKRLVRWAGTAAMAAGAAIMLYVVRQQARISDYDLLRLGQLDRRWIFSAAAALFVAGGSLSWRGVRAALSNPLTRFLSGLSFNFYIWHQRIAVWLKALRIPDYVSESPNMAGESPWQLHYTLICFGAALAVAAAVTYALEKPCAKLILKPGEARTWEKAS